MCSTAVAIHIPRLSLVGAYLPRALPQQDDRFRSLGFEARDCTWSNDDAARLNLAGVGLDLSASCWTP